LHIFKTKIRSFSIINKVKKIYTYLHTLFCVLIFWFSVENTPDNLEFGQKESKVCARIIPTRNRTQILLNNFSLANLINNLSPIALFLIICTLRK